MEIGLLKVFLTKLGELLLGLTLTALAGWFGWWYGKRLSQQGFTLQSIQSHVFSSRWKLGMVVSGSIVFVCLALWLDVNYFFFYFIAGYFAQAMLVVARSLFVMLIFYHAGLEGKFLLKNKSSMGLLLVALGITVFEGYLLWPVAATLGPGTIDKQGVIRQTTGTTCGPCSLANIRSLYGYPLSEKEAALFMQTTTVGAFANETIRGARAAGFPEADLWRTDLEQIASEDLPLILCVKLFGAWDRHAVALFGIASETLLIADPLKGLVRQPMNTFHTEWRGTCIRLGPPSFACSSSVRLSTFDWKPVREQSSK